MKLYIKNMACVRCNLVVKAELEKLGFHIFAMTTGEIEINDNLGELQQLTLKKAMQDLGLELIDDRDSILIEQIKTEIIRLVSETDKPLKIKLSDHISASIGYSYHYLSTLFSTVHGSSIERYYIRHKIERVKEMLVHDYLSFSEIAYKLHYSSVAHLSGQFKKETGLTLSRFRQIGRNNTPEPDYR